ncbi:MAG TPA: N-acetyl-D-Glu racemase DgcA [Xanthobacteraceae bacterium]|jgi:L-alanine-DL-glutamate epimerase-like enolase superfamily enzyme|nr:N-acetyl-D-Glu racemase DgcA [Xanthobacteraceae bacterium]
MELSVTIERWPLANAFTISRGSKIEAVVVVVELRDGGHRGRGEAVPYARYGETPEGVVAAIEAMRPSLEQGPDRLSLQRTMPAGAARNAVDCALWDLAAKQAGRKVYEIAGLLPPKPLVTAFTISLATPNAMAEGAERASARPLLKVKLGGGDGEDGKRIAAVRRAAPQSELIVDANEGWSDDDLAANLAACSNAGVTLIEQPLPEGRDARLTGIARPIAVCADESVHDIASLDALSGKYDAINIKLDKIGGLTEALVLRAEAERRGLAVMVGCMVSTSLAMAPALLVAQQARVVDLDGPLLLAKDRPEGLRYVGSVAHPARASLWG